MSRKDGESPRSRSKAIRVTKPPKAPEKPLMPYMRYSRKIWDSVKAAHPDQKLWEIGRIIGQLWRELPASEKQKFMDEYEAEKVDYNQALKNYHNSPAYQQYLAAKEKAQQEEKEDKRSARKVDSRIMLPPCDSIEEESDQFSNRQLAAARFQRNQRLLAEIFSSVCIPDQRGIMTTTRLQNLQRQVESLSMHKKKLEYEILAIEEKFQAKKRRFEELSDVFNECMAKLKKPAVDGDAFQKMVAKSEREQLSAYRAFVKQSQQAKSKPDEQSERAKSAASSPSCEAASCSMKTDRGDQNATAARRPSSAGEPISATVATLEGVDMGQRVSSAGNIASAKNNDCSNEKEC